MPTPVPLFVPHHLSCKTRERPEQKRSNENSSAHRPKPLPVKYTCPPHNRTKLPVLRPFWLWDVDIPPNDRANRQVFPLVLCACNISRPQRTRNKYVNRARANFLPLFSTVFSVVRSSVVSANSFFSQRSNGPFSCFITGAPIKPISKFLPHSVGSPRPRKSSNRGAVENL